ncbi:MAG TPA: hypothetical protein VGE07_05235 [Herpetosiphonaceae bacterium]
MPSYQYLADDQLNALLDTQRQRLQLLELQAADLDPLRLPLGIVTETADAQRQIALIGEELERRAKQTVATQRPRRCPGCTSDVPYGQQTCSHCGATLRF